MHQQFICCCYSIDKPHTFILLHYIICLSAKIMFNGKQKKCPVYVIRVPRQFIWQSATFAIQMSHQPGSDHRHEVALYKPKQTEMKIEQPTCDPGVTDPDAQIKRHKQSFDLSESAIKYSVKIDKIILAYFLNMPLVQRNMQYTKTQRHSELLLLLLLLSLFMNFCSTNSNANTFRFIYFYLYVGRSATPRFSAVILFQLVRNKQSNNSWT